jgi:hypothetical protein
MAHGPLEMNTVDQFNKILFILQCKAFAVSSRILVYEISLLSGLSNGMRKEPSRKSVYQNMLPQSVKPSIIRQKKTISVTGHGGP